MTFNVLTLLQAGCLTSLLLPVPRAAPLADSTTMSRTLIQSDQNELEHLRHSGDIVLQRRHAWAVFGDLTGNIPSGASPRFESWWGEGAVFTRSSAVMVRGIRGFARADPEAAAPATGHGATASADIPVLAYTLYNQAAYDHIRRHHLYLRRELQSLREAGPADDSMQGHRAVPSFPSQAMVIKTAWWPVSQHALTPLPVWDAERNRARRGGNDYLTWQRVVAVDPSSAAHSDRLENIEFAGRSFFQVRRVSLDQFHQVVLDEDLARRVGKDADAAKLAMVVLGRPLRAGDHLILVAANLATREIKDWIWSAFWWHDQAEAGSFAADRPAILQQPWRHYLMQVAFDDSRPVQADGSPHVCFNPWLEARFPDGGQGGGVMSNCVTCHRRASYPPVAFLPVTRGNADGVNDPAYAPDRLRVGFNWSLALHALP